jgi:hypothetical protein
MQETHDNKVAVLTGSLEDEKWRVFLKGLLLQVEAGSKDTWSEPFFYHLIWQKLHK